MKNFVNVYIQRSRKNKTLSNKFLTIAFHKFYQTTTRKQADKLHWNHINMEILTDLNSELISFPILACAAEGRANLWAATKAVYRFWYDLESAFIQMQTQSLQLLTFSLTTITGISFICRWQSVIESQIGFSYTITIKLTKVTLNCS